MEEETTAWPEWWDWELELSPHILKRMVDRSFNEVELRAMFSAAAQWRKSTSEGRFVISSQMRGRAWEIIVEPDEAEQRLIVITAYRKG
jgi:hypothetical protein